MPRRKQHEAQFGKYKLTKRDGSEVWYIEWYDGRAKRTKRASLGTRDREEAEAKVAEEYLKKKKVRNTDPEKVSLEFVLERYYLMHGKKIRSSSFARFAIDRFVEFFGADTTVNEIPPERQQEFVEWMESQGASNRYVKRFFTGVLRPALTHAVDNNKLSYAPPVLKPKCFEADRERDRILDQDELAALWDAIETLREADARDRLRMWLMLAINTLARPESLTELTRFQVDYKRLRIELNPKDRQQTKKRRPTVPITDALLPYLQQPGPENFIHYYGKPIRASSLNKPFRTLRDAAGLDAEVVPYSVRHTMATELAARGVDIWQIQAMLGHRKNGVTDRYLKAQPDYLGQAKAAIDDYCRELDELTEIPFLLPQTGSVVSIAAKRQRQFRASGETA
jgi:integrase